MRVVRIENKSIKYNTWKLENITLKYNIILNTLVAAMHIELNVKDENIEKDGKKRVKITKYKMIVINNMNKW